MELWERFLGSLSTRGGNVAILVLTVGGLLGIVIHVLHHGESNAQVVTVVLSTFSGFSGALLNALTGGGTRQRTADGGNGVGNGAGGARSSPAPFAPAPSAPAPTP